MWFSTRVAKSLREQQKKSQHLSLACSNCSLNLATKSLRCQRCCTTATSEPSRVASLLLLYIILACARESPSLRPPCHSGRGSKRVRPATVKIAPITGSDSLFPPARGGGSVMSLLFSYEVKACHYHDSIILTLPAKLQGAPSGGRRGRVISRRIASQSAAETPPAAAASSNSIGDGAGMGRDQLNSHSYFSSIIFDDERAIAEGRKTGGGGFHYCQRKVLRRLPHERSRMKCGRV